MSYADDVECVSPRGHHYGDSATAGDHLGLHCLSCGATRHKPTARAGDESYRGFRMTSLWAYTQVDPADDQEGVIAFLGGDATLHPMIASDRVALDSMRPMAKATAEATGRPVKLSRFSVREDLETIEP